jgi:hypothetical protein
VPWWKAEPRPELAKNARCLAAPDGFVIAYLSNGGQATVRLETGHYRVRRFDPRTGAWSGAGTAAGPEWTSPATPEGEDRAFLLTRLSAAEQAAPAGGKLPRLKVSDNQRFLVTDDGKPFFYLGDTAWELFHRLNREEAGHYLTDRAAKGFTVIQAVVLAELDGLKDPNPYGHVPLPNNDPTRPDEDYFKHVDWIVDKANELGLYVGMLPTWGDKVGPAGRSNYAGPELFTVDNAAAYGEWLGRRYKDKGIIWVLGGDRDVDSPKRADVWRAMARGLKKGDGGRNLATFHPRGGQTSSTHFHDDDWLDFNMLQTGHDVDRPVWEGIGKDYARAPTKPVFDGEPLYEDHPIGFNAAQRGYSNAADIRRTAYRSVFAGGHGYTYGNHSVWQMYAPNRRPINGPIKTWQEALDAPGAGQVRHLRALIESRPFLTRIPDQSVVASDASAGGKRVQATRDEKGRYAFVHTAAGRPVTVRLDKLSGNAVKAWWYDPRTGKAEAVGEYLRSGERTFVPPTPGENTDWVLVLDDASAGFPTPGQRR